MKQTQKDTLVGTVYVLLAITAWAVYFPYAKIVLEKLSPAVFLVFRLGIGTAVLVALSMQARNSFRLRRGDVTRVIVAGAIGIALHQLIQVTGLVYTTATNTGWILTLIPPVSGFLGWVFLKERVSRRQVIGLIIAMIGVTFFVADGRLSQLSLGHSLGDLLVLASVGTWSIYTILTKSRLATYDPLPLSTIHMAIGFLFFLVVAGWKVPVQAAALDLRDWIITIVIGIIPSGLAYFWWNAGLKRLSVVNTSTFLFIEAIIASIAGFLLLGEQFTLPMLVSAAVIVMGVYITQAKRS